MRTMRAIGGHALAWAAIVAAAGVLSCARGAAPDLTSREADRIISVYREARNIPDLSLLDRIFDPAVVVHDCSAPGDLRGLEALKSFYAGSHEGFPDFRIEFDEVFLSGDRLVSRWTIQGTHTGILRGVRPTGRPVRFSGLAIDRVSGGKIVEEWVYCNALDVAQQIGFTLVPPSPTRGPILSGVPDAIDPSASYLIYLHGRIVEEQGRTAVSPEHGPYQYDEILDAFARSGLAVIGEVRAKGTDAEACAGRVAGQIRRLLAGGVPPGRITVVGASKGAVITLRVSTMLATEGIGYVVMGGCSPELFEHLPVGLHGDVLSIYEAGDEIGQSCAPLFDRSKGPGRREEVRLDTGLRHGYLYRPLPEWLDPAVAWALGRR